MIKRPQLAWKLGAIAKRGIDGFYKGEVARRIAPDMAADGGLITAGDLAACWPVERDPLMGGYRGYTVYTSPRGTRVAPRCSTYGTSSNIST